MTGLGHRNFGNGSPTEQEGESSKGSIQAVNDAEIKVARDPVLNGCVTPGNQ